MPTSWSGWAMKDMNDYGIKFETNDYELYKLVRMRYRNLSITFRSRCPDA